MNNATEITAYRNLETGETAPSHRIGTDSDGRNLYQAVEGWEPAEAYETDEDGNWIPLGEHYELIQLDEQTQAEGVVLARLGTQEDADAEAQRMLREDASLWLSIVRVDADGIADPVVAQVEVSR